MPARSSPTRKLSTGASTSASAPCAPARTRRCSTPGSKTGSCRQQPRHNQTACNERKLTDRETSGRGVGATPDRFLVGLAVLSLIAAAADGQPLLCIVDDAQWLDEVSVQTLAFVARRLLAEPVAMVFAARERGAEALRGLPELAVG